MNIGAVEIGPLDFIGAGVGPVDFAAVCIQGQPRGNAQSGGDEVFDLGAIEISPLNFIGAGVGPVDFAAVRIQGLAPRERSIQW